MEFTEPPFGRSRLARGTAMIDAAIRKAIVKSRGDVTAARGRLGHYVRRSPDLAREMARKAIHAADFGVSVDEQFPPPAVPLFNDTHPFTAPELATMRERVQLAATTALGAAGGDVETARLGMLTAAFRDTALRDALAGLAILALR